MDYKSVAEKFMRDSFGKQPPFTPPEDMSKGEVGILTYLSFVKNGILPGELSKELKLTSGRIAIALKGLEKKGFIRRARDDKDRRKVIVTVTDSGKRHATSQKDKALTELTAIFTYLGETDTLEFLRIYNRILGND